MKLMQCETCGASSFTGNKCDYCGNEYEVIELYDDDNHDMTLHDKVYCDDGAEAYAPKQEEVETPAFIEAFEVANEHDKFILKFMASILGLIIWFAVCVFIPPLFLITICGLIIWVCKKVYKKINNNI